MAKKDEGKEVMAFDFSDDIGGGFEGTDSDSFAIPFLRVIQSGSPETKKTSSQFIKEAKEGMLFNTVTKKLYDGDEGVVVLFCAYQRRFIIWAPKGGTSTYKGEMLPEEAQEREADGELTRLNNQLYVCKNGTTPNKDVHDQVNDTRNHFCLIITEAGTAEPAMLSLSSTQIKKSKQLMGLLNGVKLDTKNGRVTPPTWMTKVRITTVAEANDLGSWYGVSFSAEGVIKDSDLYADGKKFSETVQAGTAGVKYESKDERF